MPYDYAGLEHTTARTPAGPRRSPTARGRSPGSRYSQGGASKIFDGLVTRDAKFALAEQVPTASADGPTWTATLRAGATFSDGTELSAQDVVFTYKSVLDKKVNSTIASRFDALADMTAPDERTVVFRLAYPYAPFDGTVLPPKLARSYQDKAGYRLIENPSADYRGLGIPAELPFTSDPRVRRAINLGIDRQAMIDTVLAGTGKPAATPISPYLTDWYDPDATFDHDTLYRNSTVDAALDTGRRAIDPAARKQAYSDFQQAYVADPALAFLVFLDHTYVVRDKWNGQVEQVEPHDHGLVHAVWWNLERWTPKP